MVHANRARLVEDDLFDPIYVATLEVENTNREITVSNKHTQTKLDQNFSVRSLWCNSPSPPLVKAKNVYLHPHKPDMKVPRGLLLFANTPCADFAPK